MDREGQVGQTVGLQSNSGDLAQLGERFHGMEEVRGSSPLISTRSSSLVVYVYILRSL